MAAEVDVSGVLLHQDPAAVELGAQNTVRGISTLWVSAPISGTLIDHAHHQAGGGSTAARICPVSQRRKSASDQPFSNTRAW
jgi:hypothetical protein